MSLAPEGGAAVRHRASPRVRHRARELGVELHTLRGTGPSGRILLADLAAPAESHDPPAPAPVAVIVPDAPVTTAFVAVETGCPHELASDRAGLLAVVAAATLEVLRSHRVIAAASGVVVDTSAGRVHVAEAADLTVPAIRDRLAMAPTSRVPVSAPLRLVDGDPLTLIADTVGPGELLVLGAGAVETRPVASADGDGLAIRPRLTLTASDGGLGLPVLRAVLAHVAARLTSSGGGG